jgi:hypothetical protein
LNQKNHLTAFANGRPLNEKEKSDDIVTLDLAKSPNHNPLTQTHNDSIVYKNQTMPNTQ